MEIRKAAPADFDSIWPIFRAVVAAGDTYVFSPDSTRDDAHEYWFGHGVSAFVAEADGRVAGMYKLVANQRGLGSHVANASFMVDPSAHGKGIGRAMGVHCPSEARRAGFEAMQFNFVVSSNERAVSLWKSLGFRVVGTLPRIPAFAARPGRRVRDVSRAGRPRAASLRPDLVIFDCDGVLVDSEPIANRVDTEQLNSIGLGLSPDEIMRKFVGRTKEGCIALAAELLGRDLPEGFVERWDAALMEALGKEVRAIEGVAEAIRQLDIPYCAASNSTPGRLRLSLKTSGLLPLFEGRMFSAEEVARPKPAPDLFLHAASRMGAAPDRCVVIEDTPTGARAGIAAGMTVFGFAGNAHSDVAALEAAGAKVFKSMSELASLLGGKP